MKDFKIVLVHAIDSKITLGRIPMDAGVAAPIDCKEYDIQDILEGFPRHGLMLLAIHVVTKYKDSVRDEGEQHYCGDAEEALEHTLKAYVCSYRTINLPIGMGIDGNAMCITNPFNTYSIKWLVDKVLTEREGYLETVDEVCTAIKCDWDIHFRTAWDEDEFTDYVAAYLD